MNEYIEDKDCPCTPLYIKCEYAGQNCVLHHLNYAVYYALNIMTGGIIKPYHCPLFKPLNSNEKSL